MRKNKEIRIRHKKECDKYEEEKNNEIMNKTGTLESMKSTIIKLRDNIQKLDEENENLKEEKLKMIEEFGNKIEEQKLSLISTINSHLSAAGKVSEKEKELDRSKQPTFDQLFSIVIEK